MPLDSTQQTQLQNTLNSAGRGYFAALYSSTNTNTNNSTQDGAFSIDLTPNVALASDPVLAQMTSTLLSGNCNMETVPSSSVSTNNNQPPILTYFYLSSDSEVCPVQINFQLQSQKDPIENYSVTALDYTYKASLNSSFSALNDVSSISLNGGISMSGLGTSSAYVSVQATGNIHSQKIGDIPINIQGVLQGVDSRGTLSGAIVWQFQFPAFTATFEQDYAQGVITQQLNNSSISQADFDAYFQSGGDPFYYISGLNRLE